MRIILLFFLVKLNVIEFLHEAILHSKQSIVRGAMRAHHPDTTVIGRGRSQNDKRLSQDHAFYCLRSY